MAAQFSEGWSGTPMWQLKQEREEQQKKEQRQREAQAGDLLTIESEGEAFRAILVVSRLDDAGAFIDTKFRGPRRATRAEAVSDGLLLRAASRSAKEAERTAVVQKQCNNLRTKQWTPGELPAEDTAVEEAVEEPMRQRLAAKPRGNGWQRVGDKEFFKHAHAPLAFDSKRRRYLCLNEATGQYSECDPPHDPVEYSVTVAASASLVGRSDEDVASPLRPRTLILKELIKTGAAMKLPLHFLDQPAACFVLLDGVRGGSASEWCSRNLHTKLLPRLSLSVGYWSDSAVSELLTSILAELDSQLLQQQGCCWDGVSIAVALILGSRLAVASLGSVRVLLLTPDNSWKLLGSRHDMTCEEERLRVEAACSGTGLSRGPVGDTEQLLIQKPLQERQWEAVEAHGTEEEVHRILAASPDAFATLCLEPGGCEGGAADGKAARSAYKRLALRVHPDKVPENLKARAKEAFEKVEAAAAAIEALWDSDAATTALLHRVLHVAGATGAVVSRAVAAAVLGLSEDASADDARYRQHELRKELEKLGMLTDGGLAYLEQRRGAWILEEAAEAFAAPPIKDQSSAALQAVRPTRALGLRDLKFPRPLLLAQPHVDVVQLEQEGVHHLALLSSCTASLADGEIFERIHKFQKHPKAASLLVAADAAARSKENGVVGPSAIAGCLVAVLRVGGGPEGSNTGDQETEPAAKRARKDPNMGRKVRAQHIMLKHKELKSKMDPEAHLRQKGPVTRPLAEAERELLRMKEVLTSDPKQFHIFARKHSECKSCLQPGQLAGDLGWVSRGSLGDPVLEETVLALEVHELSDLVSTPRGLHIIHRYA